MAFDWKEEFYNRISKNPSYRKMAEYATGEPNNKRNEDYFYAFKDAYERSKNYNNYGHMPEQDITDNLWDSYYGLMDNYQNNHGLYGREWERYGIPRFEQDYGTIDEFTNKGLAGWRKFLDEEYGGSDEDHQVFGHYIRNNPNKIKTIDDLKKYHHEFAPSGYDDLLEWWINKLGFKEKN